MQIVKTVQEAGNGGHIYLPKELVGSKVIVYPIKKSFEDVKSEILDILKPYLEHIIGIYIYGSYARNEQTPESDIDILVLTDIDLKIKKKSKYEILCSTIKSLESTLDNNAVLVLPIIKEAKTILNKQLIEKYKQYKLNKKNTEWYIDTTISALKIVKHALELDFGVGPIVYSLILRIKGLLTIKYMLNNSLYSKKKLYTYLKNNGIEENKIKEFYGVYSEQRDEKGISSNEITKKDLVKLFNIASKLLTEVKSIWEKAN